MKTYKINELFYSLQGEGRNTGRASAFIRFSGCNRSCPFCDTSFDSFEPLSIKQIVARIEQILPTEVVDSGSWQFVLTGGEPTLQVDSDLITTLRERFGARRVFQVETNGTRLAPFLATFPEDIRLTISPKTAEDAKEILTFLSNVKKDAQRALHNFGDDEIKIVPTAFESEKRIEILKQYEKKAPPEITLYIQPCDFGDTSKNAEEIKRCIAFVKDNPRWKLSLQTHKLLNIR